MQGGHAAFLPGHRRTDVLSEAQTSPQANAMIPHKTILDVKGHDCPEPIRRAKLALADLAVGELLQVLSTDPVSPIDFEAFCHHLPHELLSVEQHDGHIAITIKKG